MSDDELRALIERECGPVQRISDMLWAVEVARTAMAAERERWRSAALLAGNAELERLRGQVAEWEKLGDPVTLHANLLRGIPCQLDRATFLHLAGHEPPNVRGNAPDTARTD